MRTVFSCLAVLAYLTASSRARADDPHRFRLDLMQGQNTGACKVEQRLRRSLATALGYDPIDPAAADLLRVRTFRLPPAETGVYLELRDAEGAVVWQRLYQHPADNCAGLIDSATFGIEVALEGRNNPESPAPPSPSAPCPAPAPCPSCPQPRPCPPAAARGDASLGWSASFGPEALFGPLPGMTGGGALGLAFRGHRIAVGIEGRISGPASTEVPEGEILAWLSAASFVPCYRIWALEGCAVLSAGAVRTYGRGMDVPAAKTLFYAGAGGRLDTLVPVSQRILIRPYLDVVVPILPIDVTGGSQTWMMPNVAAALGVSAVFSLSSAEPSPSVYGLLPGGA